MKKMFFFMIGAILIIAGCGLDYQGPGEASSKTVLVLSFNKATVKTILPDVTMDVVSYDITGTTTGDSFSETIGAGGILALEGLTIGTWAIHVDAKNDAGVIIADADASVEIVAGQVTNETITVTPLDGNGTFNLTVDWSGAEQFTSAAVISGTLTPAGGTSVSLTFSTADEVATLTNTTWGKGYYILSINLAEGDTSCNFGDVVRIVYNATTAATVLIEDVSYTGGLSITLLQDLDNPIGITLSGPTNIMPGANMTVTSTTNPSPVDTYQWYLDGVLLTDKTLPSITLGSSLLEREAPYRLSLYVSLGEILSSEHHYFTVDSSVTALIDNFDDEDDNNLFGGTNAPWGLALTRSFDAGTLQLDYDMGLDSWSAFSFGIGSGYNDFSPYANLTFYIKGTTDSYGISMKDGANNEVLLNINSYIEGGSVIPGDYRKVTVPLSAFASVNKSNVTFIWINFAGGEMSNTTGTIYIEDLALEGAGSASSSSSSTSSTSSSEDQSLIDNFDDADDNNLFGGTNGPWGSALTRSFDAGALQIDYNMALDGWSAFSFEIGSGYNDFTSYANLTFYIKGTTDSYGISMKDGANNEVLLNINSYIEGGSVIPTDYRKVTVPLSAFGSVNKSNVTFIWINFAGGEMSNTTGTIYIEDLAVEGEGSASSVSSSASSVDGSVIDNFDDADDNNLFGGTNGPWGMALTRFFDAGALQIDYNMALDGWSAFSFSIGSGYNDFTSYTNLTFYIKGTTDNYGIAMKDGANNEVLLNINSYIESGSVIPGDYRKVTVPLSAFTSVNKSNVTFIWINFAGGEMSNTTGTIYIEDLVVE
ncbi:MAG: hypothetical protein KAT05_02495 [Spirochaetes bacterium]|nr:hypothetical protein [Spirochaetota bacterium]